MDFMEMVLLSIALSADALSIGVSYGLKGIRIPMKAKMMIFVVQVAVTGTAVFAGNSLTDILPEVFGKLLGAVLLMGLGIYTIVSAVLNKEPVECDIDHSSTIDCKEAAVMGAALSTDSFSAGISVGIGQGMNMLVPILCGIFPLIFLYIGECLHKNVGFICI